MLWWTLALLFLLTQLALAARLPTSISKWDYLLTGGVVDPLVKERLWDKALLEHGALVNNHDQLRPVFEKLQSGKPLLILGLGSVLMESTGAVARPLRLPQQRTVPSPRLSVCDSETFASTFRGSSGRWLLLLRLCRHKGPRLQVAAEV